MRLTGIRNAFLAVIAAGAMAHVWALDCGTVKSIQGDVRVERAGKSIPLQTGDSLQELDRVVVGAASSAGITLKDETLISLGPHSTLVIDGFAFDAKTNEGSVDTSLLRGAMRYVTGLVGRAKPAAVRVSTPTALVGIRGTDFIVETGGEDQDADSRRHDWHSWP